jgi:hypothetical protein
MTPKGRINQILKGEKVIVAVRNSIRSDQTGGTGQIRSQKSLLSTMTGDAASDLKAKQLESCPSDSKISIVITGSADDPSTKATFYLTQCTVVNNAVETTVENRYRYSVLLEFNDSLIHDYGAIRILRLFPPKKWVGNREGNFVQQRQDAIQNWLNELIADEELCDDLKVREFFKVAKSDS